MTSDKRNENVPVIHRDAMLRLLDRREFSSFQSLYKELMDLPPHEQMFGNFNEIFNGMSNDNESNQNSQSQDSGQTSGNQSSGHQSSASNQDEPSVPNTHDSGRDTENDEEINQSFQEISNSQPNHRLRHPRRSFPSSSTNFDRFSRELNISNSLDEGRPIDADLSENIGIFFIYVLNKVL